VAKYGGFPFTFTVALTTGQHYYRAVCDSGNKTGSSATAEVARLGGHYDVQGRSRSLMLVPGTVFSKPLRRPTMYCPRENMEATESRFRQNYDLWRYFRSKVKQSKANFTLLYFYISFFLYFSRCHVLGRCRCQRK